MKTLHAVDLQSRHTLAAPAFAKTLIELENPEEAAIYQIGDHILGGGSNTIIVGEIAQRLVQPRFAGIEIVEESADSVLLRVLAGTNWHDAVQWAVGQGYYGIENLALIYGMAGAAPVQNIGAYGVEIRNCLAAVEAYDALQQQFVRIAAADCALSYRNSRFKQDWKGRFLITAVHLRLHKRGELQRQYTGISEEVQTLPEMFAHICALRRSKLPSPERQPNVGSFFHNPLISPARFAALSACFGAIPHYAAGEAVKIPAAWLIEQCGFKGRRIGNIEMSARHALVLVNHGGSGAEILQYAETVQAAVREGFEIELVIEPDILGAKNGD